MRKIEEVLRLSAQGKSVRVISRDTGMSRTTVTRYLEKAAEHEIGWPLPAGMDVQALEQLLFAAVETPKICARQGCTQILGQQPRGRPARYCSAACRVATHRQRRRGPVTAEVHFGSASTRNRSEERSWMVKLRRDNDELIVVIGQSRDGAQRLASRLNTTARPTKAMDATRPVRSGSRVHWMACSPSLTSPK